MSRGEVYGCCYGEDSGCCTYRQGRCGLPAYSPQVGCPFSNGGSTNVFEEYRFALPALHEQESAKIRNVILAAVVKVQGSERTTAIWYGHASVVFLQDCC